MYLLSSSNSGQYSTKFNGDKTGSQLIVVSACSLQHVGAVRKSVSAGRDSDLIVLLDHLMCLECE